MESEPGKGTAFHFTARFEPAESPQADEVKLPVEALQDIRVLVVDDNSTNRLILQEMLTRWRMIPQLAEGGREALRAVADAQAGNLTFPLVILDARMPEMDGFAVACELRRAPAFASAVILMLTSDRQPEDAARCREAGITVQITKPVLEAELLQSVLLALGKQLPVRQRESTEPAASREHPVRPLRILLAEDNAVNRQLAVQLLEKRGHTVDVAGDGREVLQVLDAIGQDTLDVVLMDVQMPELDGLEATRMIRNRETQSGGHLPIIALTAHALKRDRERCFAAGMDGYVTKPLRAEEMFREIARCQAQYRPAKAPLAAARIEGPKPFTGRNGEAKVLDRQALLDHVEGDTQLLAELVRLFVQDFPRQLTALRAAAQRGDAAAFAHEAHTIKGTLGSFAAPDAYAEALALEKMGREENLAHAAEACERLDRKIGILKPLLLEVSCEVCK